MVGVLACVPEGIVHLIDGLDLNDLDIVKRAVVTEMRIKTAWKKKKIG